MTNYPAGVSGNEPQIAGSVSEVVERRGCDGSGDFVPVHWVRQVNVEYARQMRRILAGEDTTVRVAEQVAKTMYEQHTITVDCEFEGEVEIVLWQDGTGQWTCPRCGTEHEEDIGGQMREDAALEKAERDRDWID